jgi:hypothetical protein
MSANDYKNHIVGTTGIKPNEIDVYKQPAGYIRLVKQVARGTFQYVNYNVHRFVLRNIVQSCNRCEQDTMYLIQQNKYSVAFVSKYYESLFGLTYKEPEEHKYSDQYTFIDCLPSGQYRELRCDKNTGIDYDYFVNDRGMTASWNIGSYLPGYVHQEGTPHNWEALNDKSWCDIGGYIHRKNYDIDIINTFRTNRYNIISLCKNIFNNVTTCIATKGEICPGYFSEIYRDGDDSLCAVDAQLCKTSGKFADRYVKVRYGFNWEEAKETCNEFLQFITSRNAFIIPAHVTCETYKTYGVWKNGYYDGTRLWTNRIPTTVSESDVNYIAHGMSRVHIFKLNGLVEC